MNITFVYRGFESLGIEYLSAVLKNSGHKITLVYDPAILDTFHLMNNTIKKIFDYSDMIISEVVDSIPDLVAFSTTSDDYGWACKTAKEIKKRISVPIIFGGIHPTCVPEDVINQPFIDYVCVGEGEEAVWELAESLETGKTNNMIKNIWAKKNDKVYPNPLRRLNEDLDSLPFSDKDLFYKKYQGFTEHIYMLMTGRGCPYVCSYCYSGYFREIYKDKGRIVRRRSPNNVINELRVAKQKYRMKRVLFVDDVFTSDFDWLEGFLGKYKKEIDLPFGCLLFPSLGDNKEKTLSLLEGANCTSVGMGVQSIYENQRRDILQRGGSNKEIEELIGSFRKRKIFLYADIMLGVPFQSEEELIDTVYFLNKNKPDAVATLWLRYYPKAEIGKIAFEKGVITLEELRKWSDSFIYSPISRKGSTFNKELARLNVLLLFAHILPRWLLKIIINKKIYRISPTMNLHYLSTIIMICCKYISKRKKGALYFSFSERIRYVLYFMKEYFRIKLQI